MAKYTKKEFMENIMTLTSPFEESKPSNGFKPNANDLLLRAERQAVMRGIKRRLKPSVREKNP